MHRLQVQLNSKIHAMSTFTPRKHTTRSPKEWVGEPQHTWILNIIIMIKFPLPVIIFTLKIFTQYKSIFYPWRMTCCFEEKTFDLMCM
jgi:hypothetical protein